MPPDPSRIPAGREPNPSLARIRRELATARSSFIGRQAGSLLDVFELYLNTEDLRIRALETAARVSLEATGKLEQRILDLERQVIDQADRIRGLTPPGEFISDEAAALLPMPYRGEP